MAQEVFLSWAKLSDLILMSAFYDFESPTFTLADMHHGEVYRSDFIYHMCMSA